MVISGKPFIVSPGEAIVNGWKRQQPPDRRPTSADLAAQGEKGTAKRGSEGPKRLARGAKALPRAVAISRGWRVYRSDISTLKPPAAGT
jgi:hypothetical protein